MNPQVGFARHLDDCDDCIRQQGLCTYHKPAHLPQLRRNVAWLLLIGNAAIEQKARQSPPRAPLVSAASVAHARRKAFTRAIARRRHHWTR